MTTVTTSFTDRVFLAAVRAGLAATGHEGVAIERRWIDRNSSSEPFVLNVPVGADLIVPLKPLDSFQDHLAETNLDGHAEDFAGALVALDEGAQTLRRHVADIRAAVIDEIEDARRDGLDLGLCGVTIAPTYAYEMVDAPSGDAMKHLVSVVHVRHLSQQLRYIVSPYTIASPEDVPDELADLRDEQRELQEQLAELEAAGVDP